ncbi:sushi, von Willebrand factor type A, EGF and pentraxin domain-containing protein 1-like [Bolinopsis microptera]|uniref:sushi, von Willebrand factor type A, EGF and pentraxin domain-containing protein 1-like n=1 Tax=Bolinopsis microptera TaxID=2820187 RepID=UPI003079B760
MASSCFLIFLAGEIIRTTAVNEGWLPVEREVEIEWDLESTPLEVKTNSVLGSDDQVAVWLYSAGGEFAGAVGLWFFSTPQCWVSWCGTFWINLPVNPPSPTDKVWRITLTRTAGVRLVIHCNEVEVLNILLSQSTCSGSDWSTYWNRDVTKIKFWSVDTASDYYGPQPECKVLVILNASPIERVNVNTDVTVTCSEGYILNGPGVVTCQSDQSWSSVPQCEPCRGGTYRSADSTVCVPCDDNTISSEGASQCDNCGEKQVAEDGNTKCAGRCEKEELDKKFEVPSALNETTAETTVVNVTCVRPKRYVLMGETSITCQHTGTWSQQPQCRKCGYL